VKSKSSFDGIASKDLRILYATANGCWGPVSEMAKKRGRVSILDGTYKIQPSLEPNSTFLSSNSWTQEAAGLFKKYNQIFEIVKEKLPK
jgi:hypothetical protein